MPHQQDRQNLLQRFFQEVPDFRKMVDGNMENPELQTLLDTVTAPHLAKRDGGKAGFQADLDHKANVAGLFKKAGGALQNLDKFSIGRGGASFLNPAPPINTPEKAPMAPILPAQAAPQAAGGGRPTQLPQGLVGNAGRPNLGQSFLSKLFGQ